MIRREHASRRQSGRRTNRPHTNWFQRSAETMLDTVNADDRSIMATIATENPVVFYDRRSDQVMQEILVARGGRLSSWVPMLRRHRDWDLEYSLGSVLESAVSGATVRARLQFAATDDVEPIWVRVRDGHLRMVSIGGRRLQYTDIEAGTSTTIDGRRWTAGKVPLRVTTRWVQREASIVIFGADGGASTEI
ncbi:MAG: hypothetical protein AAGD07_16080 [Planctomycetota bacterium]